MTQRRRGDAETPSIWVFPLILYSILIRNVYDDFAMMEISDYCCGKLESYQQSGDNR